MDNLDLKAIAEELYLRERIEFLCTIAPSRVGDGNGCPFNPIATL